MDINPVSGQNFAAPSGGGTLGKEHQVFPRDLYIPDAGAFPEDGKVKERLKNLEIPAPAAVDATSGTQESSAKSSMLTRTLAGLFIGSTLLGMAGCKPAPPPQPGVEPTTISTELSYLLINTKQEVDLGNQVAAQIEKDNKLWQNEEAQARISTLGQSLSKTSTRADLPYTFKLIDTEEVNAFALPGGHIYVTRGLYQQYHDDNQLLFVMGHEMGHIEARHSIKALERDAAFRALIKLLTDKKGSLAGVAAEVASSLTNIRFSQSAELEADSMAARHMIRNGVNPWHAVRAMEHLKSLEKKSPELLQKIFSTHPPSQERVDNLKGIAQGYPQP